MNNNYFTERFFMKIVVETIVVRDLETEVQASARCTKYV